MGLSRLEQETVILYNAKEDFARVDTRDPVVMRRLDKLVAERPDYYSVVRETDISRTYRMPKTCVKFFKPREYTDEERAAMAERLALYRVRPIDGE